MRAPSAHLRARLVFHISEIFLFFSLSGLVFHIIYLREGIVVRPHEFPSHQRSELTLAIFLARQFATNKRSRIILNPAPENESPRIHKLLQPHDLYTRIHIRSFGSLGDKFCGNVGIWVNWPSGSGVRYRRERRALPLDCNSINRLHWRRIPDADR